jgi:hypothetical protein
MCSVVLCFQYKRLFLRNVCIIQLMYVEYRAGTYNLLPRKNKAYKYVRNII